MKTRFVAMTWIMMLIGFEGVFLTVGHGPLFFAELVLSPTIWSPLLLVVGWRLLRMRANNREAEAHSRFAIERIVLRARARLHGSSSRSRL